MTTETEIENDIPLPKTKKSRKKVKKQNPAQKLLDAIKFIKPCQKKAGTVSQQYCSMGSNWICASDEILMIGCPIDEDLVGCPQTIQLEEALKKLDEKVSITQLSENAISITSGALKAVVPCVNLEQLSISAPDSSSPVDGATLKEGFKMMNPLIVPNPENVVLGSVFLQNGSMVATNNHVLLEFWHGLDLPGKYLLPKVAISAILKTKKQITGLGFSESSVTFWFEDGSFIKTQLYNEKYINYNELLKVELPLELWETPETFFKAVKAIELFSKNSIVKFEENLLCTNDEENPSTYEIEGLPKGLAFNAKYLKMLEPCFKKVYFNEHANKAFFFSDKTRGVIVGMELN